MKDGKSYAPPVSENMAGDSVASDTIVKEGKGSHAPRIAELADSILRHKRAYYAGKPEISDAAYDALEDELRSLAPEHPVLQLVGVEVPPTSARKVAHASPMLSLQKTYVLDELKSWMDEHPVVGMLKIDGNSLSLVYEGGRLTLAKTRGNGRVGEDVTEKVHWVPSVPGRIKGFGGSVEVRGELYCTESDFIKLSDEMASLGLDRPTSPRNIVAGLLGRKEHAELARYFAFFAFDLSEAGRSAFKSETEKFAALAKLGFRLPYPKHLSDFTAAAVYLDEARALAAEDDILIDGAVFSYDDLRLHEALGNTAHHPRYKMSFKWQGQTAVSTIREILWQTSRLGVVTPVAVIEPVFLSGAQITNVTLHNAAHVRAFDLKPGDQIEIVRSGEVIPKFLAVTQPAAGRKHHVWPSDCSACHSALVFDGVRLRCPNRDSCPAQQLRSILNWIKSVAIDDLSEKRLEHLLQLGLVGSISDLYRLRLEDYLKIPLTKEKMAQKLYENVQNSRHVPLARFLNGLGIEGAGLTTWEKLLEHYPSLTALQSASAEDIAHIEGFAEKSAQQITGGLREHKALIAELLAAGVSPEAPHATSAADAAHLPLAGKHIAITGTLSRPRAEIEEAIKAAGGRPASSLSKTTAALVTADPTATSTKAKKARELGVPLWSEADLWQHIGQKP